MFVEKNILSIFLHVTCFSQFYEMVFKKAFFLTLGLFNLTKLRILTRAVSDRTVQMLSGCVAEKLVIYHETLRMRIFHFIISWSSERCV